MCRLYIQVKKNQIIQINCAEKKQKNEKNEKKENEMISPVHRHASGERQCGCNR